MALDLFFELPGVPGESVDRDHLGTIQVLSFSWGMSQGRSMHVGDSTSKPQVNDLAITKFVDRASTRLMQLCAQGTVIEKATLYIRKAGQHQFDLFTITLRRAIVSSITCATRSSQDSGYSEDILTESVAIHFAEITVAYSAQDNTGRGIPAGNFSWNIPRGRVP
jgi:type VI secretion system secreted protein Hcp